MARELTLPPEEVELPQQAPAAAPVAPPRPDVEPGTPSWTDGTDAQQPVQAASVSDIPEPQPVAPPAPPPDLVPMVKSDPVREYLQSKLNSRHEIDPKLQQAMQMEAFDKLTNAAGRGMGNAGDAIAHNARSFANAIAGKGFQSEETPASAKIQPYDESQSPVQQYLLAKRAQQADAAGDLSEAKAQLALRKASEGKDGDGIEAGKLKLGQDALQFRKDSFEKTQPLKEHASERQDSTLALNVQKFGEVEGYHKALLDLRARGLTESAAKDSLNQQKYQLQRQRLGLQDEKQENQEDKGVIPGWKTHGYVDPIQKRDFLKANAAAGLADSSLAKMEDLVRGGTLNRLSPMSRERAIMDVYSHEVLPQINTAQAGGVFANGRAQLLQAALSDPNGFRQLMLDSVSSNSIDKIRAFREILHESALSRGKAIGAEPLGDIYGTPEVGQVESARENRPGSEGYIKRVQHKAPAPKIGQSAGEVGKTVKVRRKSDGKTKTVSAEDAKSILSDPNFETVQ